MTIHILVGCECPRKIVTPIIKSQTLGMTKGGVALPLGFDAGGENCRSLGYPGFPVELSGFREMHAPFLKERRMKFAEATKFHRKSGVA
jgi:hypothetical protein